MNKEIDIQCQVMRRSMKQMKLDKVLRMVSGGNGLSEESSGEMSFELRPQRSREG